MKKLIGLTSAALLLAGCGNLQHNVVVTTGTYLGVSVTENPQTQLYEAKLGYGRSEFAYVPGDTNHPATVPPVLMEIRIQNIFTGGLVYQRLAVGSEAVSQAGAALMFAKDSDGKLSTNAAQAVASKIKSIPDAPLK